MRARPHSIHRRRRLGRAQVVVVGCQAAAWLAVVVGVLIVAVR